jgi:hypothetical protein
VEVPHLMQVASRVMEQVNSHNPLLAPVDGTSAQPKISPEIKSRLMGLYLIERREWPGRPTLANAQRRPPREGQAVILTRRGLAAQLSMISRIFRAKASISKGFVTTCSPVPGWPVPAAIRSA